jgi:hypothetical protein
MNDIEIHIRRVVNGYIIVCSSSEEHEEFIAYDRKEATDLANELLYAAEQYLNLTHLAGSSDNEK